MVPHIVYTQNQKCAMPVPDCAYKHNIGLFVCLLPADVWHNCWTLESECPQALLAHLVPVLVRTAHVTHKYTVGKVQCSDTKQVVHIVTIRL
jgi:predicted metal-binding protein